MTNKERGLLKSKRMTFDEYDAMVEKFEQVKKITFYPTLEQLDLMEKEPLKWIITCCYLYEMGKKPVNKEEDYSRKSLRNFVDEHLELFDTKEEVMEADEGELRRIKASM